MLRIADTFEFAPVSDRLRLVLYASPLLGYARNCWHGGIYLGEKPAPIVKTQGTDTFSECLAFTTMHLALRVAESGLRGYDALAEPAAERQASRLAALFAHRLTETLISEIFEDRAGVGFDSKERNIDKTVDSFRKVSQVMYPAIAEMRDAVAHYAHADNGLVWARAIDHALFISAERSPFEQTQERDALARLLDSTLEAFYPFFLSRVFGEGVYARFESAYDDDRKR